jgi:hypothetical protein
LVASIAGAAALAHQAAEPQPEQAVQPVPLKSLKPEPRNRIGLSYRMGLNITADFRRLGGLAPVSDPGAETGGVMDRTYDNGYNLVDITGNDHGPGFENTTWYWGYGPGSSVQGNSIAVSSSSSPATARTENNGDDPQHGFELTYSRQYWERGNWRFGFEGGLGYTRLNISENRRLVATVNRITDTFEVPTIVLPPSPYQGTFEGPGPVISSEPLQRQTSVVVSSTNTIVGGRELDANVYSIRLGPYAEVPLNDKFTLLFSGGLYMAIGDTKFSFREEVTLPGTGTETHRGSHSQTDFLVGGYVGANVAYALTEEIDVFVGAQFQGAGTSVNKARGKVSVLDIGESVVVSIGASYSF